MARHYKDLIAWRKAMDLVNTVYDVTDRFPKREIYSLMDQIRRAVVSIPSNIAEGQAHYCNREFLHFFVTLGVRWQSLKLNYSLHRREVI